MALDAEKRRVSRLLELARPRQSIASRVASLSPSERAFYDQLRHECSEQANKYDDRPGRYYELIIEGEIEHPILPYWVRDKLYNPIPIITKNMTNEQVRDAYRKFMENGQ